MKKILHNREANPAYLPVFSGPEFPLSRRGIAAIHGASLEVLDNTGFRFASESALTIFKSHGFRIEGQRVYFTERQIRRALASIPRSFKILARNPKHDIIIKPGVSSFGLGRGAVNMIHSDGSIRRLSLIHI